VIAALTLALALQAGGADLGPGEARATVARADGSDAAIRVGDLVRFRVEAATAGGVGLGLDPEFDVALEVVDAETRTDAREDGLRVDVFDWTLRVLGTGPGEGGALETPRLALGSGTSDPVEVAPVRFEVAAAFGEDEVTARPVPGFRDPVDRRVGDPAVALAVLGLALLLPLAGLAFARGRARRRADAAAPPPPRTPRERLADLPPDAAPAAAIGALAPIVRLLTDAARGVDDGASTDEEWAERVRADRAIPEDLSERAAALVLESSAVRYGGGAPTSFAAREAKERALELADALARVGALDAASETGAAPEADAAAETPQEVAP